MVFYELHHSVFYNRNENENNNNNNENIHETPNLCITSLS